jgi:uncharacterized protein (TIGR03067 family)
MGEVSVRVIDLEMKVRKAMGLTRLKLAAAVALAVIMTGAGVPALPGALAAADDRARVDSELTKLQGTWLIAAFEQAGVKKDANGKGEQYKIEGESFEVWHNGHVEEKGTIRLDPSKNPMLIDFQFKEGRKKGKTDLAIFAWEGVKLKLCWVRDGHQPPADFTTKSGDNRVLVILNRQ